MADKLMTNPTRQSWLYHPRFPEQWTRGALYSLATWVNGLAFRNIQFSETGMPVIKIAEIKGGLSGQTKFTQQTFDESVRVRPGDMLFSWSGQPETSIDVFWWNGPEGWLNQHVFRVTPKPCVHRTFFYYLLRYLRPNFVGIASNKQTTGLGHVTKRDLENMEVAYPDPKEQQAIAHILGTRDEKIELNRQLHKTLEQMARALFKSWFIDFDPVKRNIAKKAGKNQPSPRPPLPMGEGRRGEAAAGLHYRGGYDFAGLLETVRELRKKQTPAEVIFWELVRDRRFMGLKFRRQHQLGDYIVDFYCHEHRLVIELDGGVHASMQKKDHKRDKWMEAQGFTVLRFPNKQILEDPQSVLEQIAAHCAVSRGEGSSPFPLGEGQGEGCVEAFDALFPDSFQDSELGKIPKGWRIRKLGEICTLSYGKALKAEDRLAGDIPVMGSNGPVGSHNQALVKGPGIVVGRKGNPGIVKWVNTDFFPIDTTFYVVPKKPDMPLTFLVHALETLNLPSLGADSAVPGLNRDIAYQSQLIVPESQILAAFAKQGVSIRDRIEAGENESRTLAALRDTLLPKLISGELRVPDAERIVGRAE